MVDLPKYAASRKICKDYYKCTDLLKNELDYTKSHKEIISDYWHDAKSSLRTNSEVLDPSPKEPL